MSESKHLIKQISQGDKVAFQKLYVLFKDRVYNTSIGYVQNSSDAEEITQDVFLKIYKSAERFKGDSEVSTWIYRITINTSLNFIQSKKRRAFLDFNKSELENPTFEHPGVILENKENAKILFGVIQGLPDQQKTAFILSFIEELPRQEVAVIMEISLKAVESLLQRAKSNLREKLKNIYPDRRK